MRPFRDQSIRRKLTAMLILVVSIVLLIQSVFHFVLSIGSARESMIREFTMLADVLSASSDATLSEDPDSVQPVLDVLAAEPTVELGCIYDRTGRVVAQYRAKGAPSSSIPKAKPDAAVFADDGYLDVFQSVNFEEQFVGTIFLRVRTDEVQAAIRRTVLVTVVGFAVGVLIAMVLSFLLQRVLTRPLLQLSDAMQSVTHDRNYSIRVAKPGTDEIGILCDGFNAMLAEIQERDAELRIHRLRLEETVERRTWLLKAKTEELTRSNTELEQFAYISSHDLQEPLRKIQAFGDMLANQYRDVLGDEGRDFLQRMQGAAKRMQGLINELLNYSRITTKAQPFVQVSLDDVARHVLIDLETRIQETGGRVELQPLPTLEGDPTQMRQLLQNLIGNSLKYHRADVPPVVKVQGRLLPIGDRAFPSQGPPIQFCEITVEDNGIGFEQKYVDRIFAPFERLHGRGEYEGTGMGLAICRKIVERHGGTITARSVPHQGSTFLVTIPLIQSKGAPKDEPV